MARKWAPYEVTWNDAHGAETDGWISIESLSHKPQLIRSVGMLWKDDDAGITLVLSLDKQSGHVGEYLFIPRACVVSVTMLEPVK